MKISTFVIAWVLVAVVGMAGVLAGGILASRSYYDAIEKNVFAEQLSTNSFRLVLLTSDYILHPDNRNRIERQWLTTWQSMEKMLSRQDFTDADIGLSLAKLRKYHYKTHKLFLRVLRKDDALPLAEGETAPFADHERAILAQIQLFTQNLASEASHLFAQSKTDLGEATRITGILIVTFLALLATLSAAFLIAVMWRIVRPLRRLSREISRFGAETKMFRLSLGRADEIGDVVNSFNRMADRLHQTTVSRDELMEEVAERKQAEEALAASEKRFRLLVEEAVDGINVHDLDGQILVVNRRLCEMLGYTRKELLSLKAWNFENNLTEEGLYAIWKTLTPNNPHQMEGIHRRKDGSTYPAEIRFSLIEWEGKPAVLAFTRDITERKQLEAQYQQAQKMEAVGTLAGGIAHNFNNLLQIVMSNISLVLMESDPSHPRHKILTKVIDRVKSGAELTKQIVAFARGGKYQVTPTDLNALLLRTANLVGSAHVDISIQKKFATALWVAKVDQNQIEQVLLNLLINSQEAMPRGGQLFLQTENVALEETFSKLHDVAPGKYVKMSVRDAGIGMAAETMSRVFDPFFTTKEMASGSGLGLASAYGTIKNHGGIITVNSEEGVGTTFDVYLPAVEEEIGEGKKEPEAEKWTRKGTILLVDDEEGLVSSGLLSLKMFGFETFGAASGVEAIRIYEKNRKKIDMVILDMIMPDMGGGEVFDKLRELDPNVKVLLSSGYSLEGEAKEIMGRGCDAFIQKPFDLDALSEKIREVLDPA